MGIAWFIRLLLGLLLVRLVWRLVSGMVAGAAGPRRVPPQRAVPLVRDPVCGTFVDQSRALTTKRGGAVHYFCSEGCRREYSRQG